jgi:hypothetical protein
MRLYAKEFVEGLLNDLLQYAIPELYTGSESELTPASSCYLAGRKHGGRQVGDS